MLNCIRYLAPSTQGAEKNETELNGSGQSYRKRSRLESLQSTHISDKFPRVAFQRVRGDSFGRCTTVVRMIVNEALKVLKGYSGSPKNPKTSHLLTRELHQSDCFRIKLTISYLFIIT